MIRETLTKILIGAAFAGFVFCFGATAKAQTTAFTYQGKLTDGTNSSPTGTYDLRFTLDTGDFLVSCSGAATTNNICQDVSVVNGIFTVRLDFGAAAFTGGAIQTLGIGVRRGDETGAFTPLSPAQPITSAPYAIQSLNAAQIGGVTAANIARRDAVNTFAGNQTINGNLTQTGTTSDLNLTNGFIARGTLSTGTIPTTGAGVRMMFYPGKAAFRAGTVNGSQWNDANIGQSSIALGENVTANGNNSTALGVGTTASGFGSTALGFETTASGINSTALGFQTTANSGYSTALGFQTIASGGYATALGSYASTDGKQGSFVYGDVSTTNLLTPTFNNQFAVRAIGGYRLLTNAAMTTGVTVSPGGGAWNSISDRNAKENFGAVNSRDILQKVINLPISTWSYKGQTYRHIGAMAQDFYSAFNVGENDTTITTVDPDGVAFAAIQGLNEELNEQTTELKAENERLKERFDAQQKQIGEQQTIIVEQRKTLDALKKIVCAANQSADVCRQP